MIIDCHAHYEPRILNEDDLIRSMDAVGVEKMVLIPLLTDPPETKKPDFPMLVQRIMFNSNLLRPLGILITQSMYKNDGEWNLWLKKKDGGSQTYKLITEPDNQMVVDVISRHPTRFLGWTFVNPNNENALDQLEHWRHFPGMIGVKIHPFWHRYDIQKVKIVAERSQELGLPMLVHLGFGPHGDYRWLIENFPKLKIIFGHLGVPYYKSLWPSVHNNPNVYVDISSSYHVDERLFKSSIKRIGSHKLLFGTDSPYAHGDVIKKIKTWVDDAAISENEKEDIFSNNFLKLIQT